VAEAPKPAAEAPKAAARAPTEFKSTKPRAKAAAQEPSLLDEFLDNPLALGGLLLVILLLVGYGVWAWRRKKASQSRFQDSVLGAASAPAAGAAAASSAAGGPVSSQISSQPPVAGMEPEEVDPIAEADVYMAYGRDSQAEEILKEALQKDPNRVAIHAKLLEIYANRRDKAAFEQTAVKLKGLTNGAGPEWDKAAALGRSLDPQNGLYGGGATTTGPGPGAAAAAAAAAVVPAAAPSLDFDLGAGNAQEPTLPDIPLDAGKERTAAPALDFDLGASTAETKPEKTDFTPEGTLIMGGEKAPESPLSGLDFDLDLSSPEEKAARPASPPSAPAGPAAGETSPSIDFDLDLDLGGTEEKGAADAPPAQAAPLDLSSIDLDLSEPAASTSGTGSDPKWQEVATKLDLAKAYEEMGDKDGARELLAEVVREGDAVQKGEAEQMLAKLG
jgi:pilus assembly protein FimV